MPYRVKINPQQWAEHHEAYFVELPTKEMVLRSVQQHREIADEAYGKFYDLIQGIVENFDWPEEWSVDMSAVGKLAFLKGLKPHVGYVRIHRFQFVD